MYLLLVNIGSPCWVKSSNHHFPAIQRIQFNPQEDLIF